MGALTDDGKNFLDTVGGDFGFGPKATPNTSGYAPSPMENEFTQALLARYNGTAGPSAAQLAMTQGLNQANANAMGAAAGARGIQPGLANLQGQRQQAANSQNIIGQSGVLGAQETAAAGGNLAGLLSSQRQSASAANQLQASVQQSQANRLLSGSGMGMSAMAMMAGGGEVGDYHGTLLSLADPGSAQKSPIDFLKKKTAGGGAEEDEMIMGAPMDPGVSGGMSGMATMVAARGAEVPGEASVAGDSLKNDKVKALLSPGEIVLPRTVAQAGDAPDKAAEFVASLKGKGDKKERPKNYGDVLSKHRKLEERVKELEARLKKK